MIFKYLAWIILLLTWSSRPTPAFADEATEHGQHSGAVLWAEEYCKGDIGDRPGMLRDVYEQGDPAEKKRFVMGIEQGFRATKQLAAKGGSAAVCWFIEHAHGTNGVAVKGFWIAK